MERKMRKQLLGLGLLAGIGMICLTGCKEEEKVDYTIEGVTEEIQLQSNEAKSGVAQFQDITEWDDKWTISSENALMGPSTIDIKIDAKITIPEVEQMSVIEVVEPEFDEEYKEKIAKHLFETADIYYGDISHLIKKDLDEMGALDKDDFQSEEEYEEYETALENPKDSYTLVDAYGENEYIGTYGGVTYKLSFTEEYEYEVLRMKEVHFEPKDVQDVCPEDLQGKDEISYKPWTQEKNAENQAEISEEDALKKAQDLVGKLGMDYSVLSDSCPLVWRAKSSSEEGTEDEITNGYVFTFDIGIDNISFVEYGVEEHYINLWANEYVSYLLSGKSGKKSLYSLDTQMQIYVTDKGVIKMNVSNPLVPVGITEQVELLSLSTIQDIIKEQFETNHSNLRLMPVISDIWYDRMELIYFRVCDEENPEQYSYVPVWRLAYVTTDAASQPVTIRDSILINAIDGSVIDLFSDL